MKRREAVASVFLILSDFWKPPTKAFYCALADGTTDGEIAEALRASNNEKLDTCECGFRFSLPPFEQLQSIYLQCFLGIGSVSALPVESVYKKWTSDETTRLPIAGSKGYLMGDPGQHVQYLFSQYQLDIPVEYRMMPDHLTLLLEFAAFMVRERESNEIRVFLQDHFDWLDEFSKAVSESLYSNQIDDTESHRFFQMNISLIKAVVAAEISYCSGGSGGKFIKRKQWERYYN